MKLVRAKSGEAETDAAPVAVIAAAAAGTDSGGGVFRLCRKPSAKAQRGFRDSIQQITRAPVRL